VQHDAEHATPGGLDIVFGLAGCLPRCEARLDDEDDPVN
jgi:hypothetical protein